MVQAAVDVGVDRHRFGGVGVPVLPAVVAEVLAVDVDDLQQVDAVALGEGEVALVVRRHAHDGAVAVAHQHVVADPERDRLVAERMLDDEAGGHAALVLAGLLDLAGAAGLARLEEGGDLGARLGGAQRQRVLGRDGAEGDAHDGVGARREDPQPAVADELAGGVGDAVREGEANAGRSGRRREARRLTAGSSGRSRGSRASRRQRRSASRDPRRPARWRARSGRPDPS